MDIEPIGVIRTPFTQAEGTPIQSAVAAGAEGRVEVYPAFADGLKDLDGFDRVWLLYWFDRAAPARLRVVPYLDEVERGVFATRAPCRPNPIGISSVRLVRVVGNVLHVREVDMLDGTPLLDIKPYAPRFDHFEVGRCGWLDAAGTDRRRADERFTRRQKGEER
jgi:tRNA-Thr(GGU) m(6)t(6)A37 methyltransferase TsaA